MEIPEKVLERARTRWVLDPATGCHVSTNVTDELTRRWNTGTHYYNRHTGQWTRRPRKKVV